MWKWGEVFSPMRVHSVPEQENRLNLLGRLSFLVIPQADLPSPPNYNLADGGAKRAHLSATAEVFL